MIYFDIQTNNTLNKTKTDLWIVLTFRLKGIIRVTNK